MLIIVEPLNSQGAGALSEAPYLRLQAQRARRLAREICDDEISAKLIAFADELDARAAELDAQEEPKGEAC